MGGSSLTPGKYMKNSKYNVFIFLILPTLVLWPASLCAKSPGSLLSLEVRQNSASPPTHAGMEWEGHVSQQKEKFVKVVVTQEEWVALWRRAFDEPAPALDFKRYAVACIFLGHSAPWLFSIGIGKPYVRETTIVIPYGLADMILELVRPFKASGQYSMKVFEKTQGYNFELEETLYSDNFLLPNQQGKLR
jgi:hypothetical protein